MARWGSSESETHENVQVLHALFNERYGQLVALAAVLLGSRVEAEDVVQDAFAGAIRQRDRLRGDAAGYIVQSVANGSRSRLRRRAVERRPRPVEPAPLPGDSDSELFDLVLRLPTRQAEVIVCRTVLDLTFDQTAKRHRPASAGGRFGSGGSCAECDSRRSDRIGQSTVVHGADRGWAIRWVRRNSRSVLVWRSDTWTVGSRRWCCPERRRLRTGRHEICGSDRQRRCCGIDPRVERAQRRPAFRPCRERGRCRGRSGDDRRHSGHLNRRVVPKRSARGRLDTGVVPAPTATSCHSQTTPRDRPKLHSEQSPSLRRVLQAGTQTA